MITAVDSFQPRHCYPSPMVKLKGKNIQVFRNFHMKMLKNKSNDLIYCVLSSEDTVKWLINLKKYLYKAAQLLTQ